MKYNYPYLKDDVFLLQMDNLPVKEQYTKITVLDWKENPIEEIQGKVNSGSLNFDGNSAVRRTGNISMTVGAETLDGTTIEKLLTINKKISIEVGFKNTTNQYLDYPIIWYPLGIYVLFNPSFSHSSQGLTFSLSLKDKMCLLNGDCGGTLPSSVTFSEKEYLNSNGETQIEKVLIYQIIQELVNHFGGEQLSKIIISDIDTRLRQVMKWTGANPVYIKHDDSQSWDITENEEYVKSQPDAAKYVRYSTGMDIGYIYTDFTYPDELIGNAGETVCTILDKIKNTLGNYEYYYDYEGNFIFQEIKNYLNTTKAKDILEQLNKNTNGSSYLVDITKGKSVYSFKEGMLVTSYSNSPQWQNIKNDFIVWGIRENIDGMKLPIRYHLAIDKKPEIEKKHSPMEIVEDEEKLQHLVKTSSSQGKEYVSKDWRSELYLQGVESESLAYDAGYYYPELNNEWLKLYDMDKEDFKDEVKQAPYNLDYFLDFIDSDAAIGEFSVSNIGRRTKVVNDEKINCLFEPDVPFVVLIEAGTEETDKLRDEAQRRGENYCQVPTQIYQKIEIGGTYNSAFNMIKDLLYQYTNYNESVNLQVIPIYHLQPNTRIEIQDIEQQIQGDFMIKSFTLPLDVNGTMSIQANKALTKI